MKLLLSQAFFGGFYLIAGVICEININECEDRPCENGGTCVDGITEYTCNCPPIDKDGISWGGKNCSTQLTGCLGHSCENRATCFPHLANGVHNYTCKCPPGFHGISCSTSTTFSLSDGYIIVESPDRNNSGRAPVKQLISISFRTTLPNGILVCQGDNEEHLFLELYGGQLTSSVRVNNETIHIAFSEQVNDGQWHKAVIYLGQEFLVNLTHPNCPNGTCSDIRTTRGTVDSLLNSLTVTYVGGHSEALLSKKTKSKRNFIGCLRDLNIDLSTVLPQEISEFSAWNFTLGCQRTVWCQPGTCHGRGECVDLWTSYWCSCIRPYTGPTCLQEYISGTFGHENTSSSALFIVSDNPGSRFTFSFFIRTLKANSLLFEFIGNATTPYLVMYLQQGHLSIKARDTTLQSSMNIADGIKRLIILQFDGEWVSVTHSGSFLLNNHLATLQVRPMDSIHIGEDSSEQREHFKGCLQDVRLNNNQMEFYPLKIENYTPPISVYTSLDLTRVGPNCTSDNSCLSTPCQNGGNCSVTWNDYQCLCPKEFRGKACEDQVWCQTVQCPAGSQCVDIPGGYECHANATFQGADPIVYIGNNSITRDLTSISLVLRTRARAGVLLQASNGADSMWLGFHNSQLLFQLKTGNSVEEGLSLSSHINISNGLWHSVLVSMEEPSARLSRWLITINKQLDTGSAMASGNLNFLRSDVNITLSGNFTGCLGIAKLGGIHLPYLQQTPISLSEHFVLFSDPPPQIGCFGTEMCSPDPCQNNGSCQDLFESFHCACSPGWEGPRCQINIDECMSGPCLHGNCTDLVDGYQCTCCQGFTGTNCEQDIDNCVGHSCQNGGSCIDGINSFFCTCPSNFTGQYCEWSYPPVDCGENFSCYHGGHCTDGIWGANCTCTPGFTGERCEKDINECIPNPCQNGGACQDLLNRFECICGANFAGEQCQLDRGAQTEHVPLAAVIVPVVCGSALLVVITLIFVVLTARKKRQTEGTYNPSQQEVAGARLEMDSVLKVPPEERLI